LQHFFMNYNRKAENNEHLMKMYEKEDFEGSSGKF